MKESVIKLIDKILTDKKMFVRVIILLGIIAAVTCYGFYSGEISKIIAALVK